jgi:hypothetical protein
MKTSDSRRGIGVLTQAASAVFGVLTDWNSHPLFH